MRVSESDLARMGGKPVKAKRPRAPKSPRVIGADTGSAGERAMHLRLDAAGIGGFVREYRFSTLGRWRFDFAWPEHLVALEIEGGTWTNGRHNRGPGFEKDCEKYNEAASLGWSVLRVPTQWVTNGRAIAAVARCLEAKGVE